MSPKRLITEAAVAVPLPTTETNLVEFPAAESGSMPVSAGGIEDRFELVRLGLLYESKTNPRRTFDEKSMADLTANVRHHGVLEPLIVRPRPVEKFDRSKATQFHVFGKLRQAWAGELTRIENSLGSMVIGTNTLTVNKSRPSAARSRAVRCNPGPSGSRRSSQFSSPGACVFGRWLTATKLAVLRQKNRRRRLQTGTTIGVLRECGRKRTNSRNRASRRSE